MASFFCGCGAGPPRQAGWRRPDASRLITNTREGGPVTAFPSSARLPQWVKTGRPRPALIHVRFGPQPDSCTAADGILLNHLVGELLQVRGHVEPEGLCGVDVDD